MVQSVRKMCVKYVVLVTLMGALGSAARVNSISDILQRSLNWDCANNATCVKNVQQELINGLQNRKSLDFGIASIEPVEGHQAPINTGRGFVSTVFSENAIRIPFGGLAINLQRSPEHKDYIEFSVMKNSAEGRGQGGFGGGRGKNKKYIQTFIPLFLAFNAVGWLLLAAKAVAVLTVKALFISKIALVVAAISVIKKLMDSATEKIMASHHGFDHSASDHVVMPYSMEYALPSQHYHSTAELTPSDLYPVQLPGQEGFNPQSLVQESLSAESSNNLGSSLAGLSNGSGKSGISTVAKVKRHDDSYAGYAKKPIAFGGANTGNPVYFYNKA